MTAAASDPITALGVVTLVVAILGALTGVAALVWQAATWRLSGPRIRVELKVAWLGAGGAVVGVPGTWEPGVPPNDSFIEECFAVEARNLGRMHASIRGWSVAIGVASLGHHVAPWNPPLPHRLDAGESATWFVNRGQVEAVVGALRSSNAKGGWQGRRRDYVQPEVLRAVIDIGDGKTHRSHAFRLDLKEQNASDS